MASINVPDIKIYLINPTNGEFYYATQNADGTYNVATTPDERAILHLPVDWQGTKVKWQRHPEYLGMFRSQGQTFKFVKDARAILMELYYAAGGWIQAKCNMRFDVFIDVNAGYQTTYTSQINFAEVDDEKSSPDYGGTGGNQIDQGEFSASTLDSELFELVQAYGPTKFNMPIWKNTGTTDAPVWVPYEDVDFVLHNGIKLLYQANYISAAAPDNIISYNGQRGFNKGNHGTGINIGFHTIPNMNQYSITQNNGTTTFIGNDILNNIIVQGNQSPGAGAIVNEVNFDGTNNSNPFTKNNYSIKNLQPTPDGYIDLNVSVSGQFSGDISYIISGAPTDVFIKIVLFEIGPGDVCTPQPGFPGRFGFIELYKLVMPTSGSGDPIVFHPPDVGKFNTASSSVDFQMKDNMAYILGVIFDGDITSEAWIVNYAFADLQMSIFSKYDSGTSGIPIPAPMLNPTTFPALSLTSLLKRIVPNLATTNTDGWGFPLPLIDNPYSGVSTFLDSTDPIGDCVPKNIKLSSSYCVHDLQGQSYISMSLNQLFMLCKFQLGCGLAIKDNTVEIERLTHYFDKDTMILDLGGNVAKMKIRPFKDMAGCNLKLGYSKADTNSDFGVDAFITELFYNTPLSKTPQTIEWETDDVLFEQYAIEKIRAQRVNQPIGVGYDPASPSSDNQAIGFYCAPSTVTPPLDQYPYDPSNNRIDIAPYAISIYPVLQRNGVALCGGLPAAQSTDPTAATQPYIYGMYYPDSAINVELSPCRAFQRDGGALLHSVLDEMDEEYLVFRKTAVIQYNNTLADLASIQSNLNIGAGGPVTTEFKDIAINSLPAKLLRPFIIDIETVGGVNTYNAINVNPNGYVRWVWKGLEWKAFLWMVENDIAVSQPTTMQLICHPDITNDQLKRA